MTRKKVTIRPVQIADASAFLKILKGGFEFFSARPRSLKEEKDILRAEKLKNKQGVKFSCAILLDDKVIGGISLKINPHRRIVGEIGYFLKREYWGQGITVEAVGLMEKLCFELGGMKRIEIVMMLENKASERVAQKCGYIKEGLLRGAIMDKNGKMKDVWMYSKTIEDYEKNRV